MLWLLLEHRQWISLDGVRNRFLIPLVREFKFHHIRWVHQLEALKQLNPRSNSSGQHSLAIVLVEFRLTLTTFSGMEVPMEPTGMTSSVKMASSVLHWPTLRLEDLPLDLHTNSELEPTMFMVGVRSRIQVQSKQPLNLKTQLHLLWLSTISWFRYHGVCPMKIAQPLMVIGCILLMLTESSNLRLTIATVLLNLLSLNDSVRFQCQC